MLFMFIYSFKYSKLRCKLALLQVMDSLQLCLCKSDPVGHPFLGKCRLTYLSDLLYVIALKYLTYCFSAHWFLTEGSGPPCQFTQTLMPICLNMVNQSHEIRSSELPLSLFVRLSHDISCLLISFNPIPHCCSTTFNFRGFRNL